MADAAGRFAATLVNSCLCGFGFTFASRFANDAYDWISGRTRKRRRQKRLQEEAARFSGVDPGPGRALGHGRQAIHPHMPVEVG